MKRIIAITLISIALLINISCSRDVKISVNPMNSLYVIHQIANKDSYNKFIRPEKDYYIFYSDNEYRSFIKQYFISQSKFENINFKRNDLLLINCKWGNKLNGSSYNVESMYRRDSKIIILMKKDGQGSIEKNNLGIAVEEFTYIELPKGTIKLNDTIIVNRK